MQLKRLHYIPGFWRGGVALAVNQMVPRLDRPVADSAILCAFAQTDLWAVCCGDHNGYRRYYRPRTLDVDYNGYIPGIHGNYRRDGLCPKLRIHYYTSP